MSPLPARVLQPQATAARPRYQETLRELDRQEYILAAARNVFLQHGTNRVTLTEFACAAGLAPSTVRRYVCDIHHLFAMVLHQHLKAITDAICAVPAGDGALSRRRAAYFNATRGICMVPTPMHFLLLRDRFSLPEDELDQIEASLATIASLVGGQHANHILGLLDSPTYDLPQIEAAFAAVADLKEAQARPILPAPVLPAPVLAAPILPVSEATPAQDPPPDPPRPPARPARPHSFAGLDDSLANIPDSDLLAAGGDIAARQPDQPRHDPHIPQACPAASAARPGAPARLPQARSITPDTGHAPASPGRPANGLIPPSSPARDPPAPRPRAWL